MQRTLFLLLAVGCDPGVDIGPIDITSTTGDKGVADFAFADGCPDETFLGCNWPALAVGASARIVVTAADGDGATTDLLARATPRSSSPDVAVPSRDAVGTLVVTGVAPGWTEIELVGDHGIVVDQIGIFVEAIGGLAPPVDDSNAVMAGARIGARVIAGGGAKTLFARGAITATTSGALARAADTGGFFSASDQLVVAGDQAGDATVSFRAGDIALDVPYTVVTPAMITRLDLGGATIDATDRDHTDVIATGYFGGSEVRGGPVCDWHIISGNAWLAPRTLDDTSFRLLPVYTTALVSGSGDVDLECRANPRVAARVTVRLKA